MFVVVAEKLIVNVLNDLKLVLLEHYIILPEEAYVGRKPSIARISVT